MRPKQYAQAKYDAVATVYDQRWQRYHADTLGRAARYVTSVPAGRILDVPCGTGELARWLLPRVADAHIIGVDGSAAMLRVARDKWHAESRLSFLQAVAETLPFESHVFDWVVCCNSLHYLRQPERMLAEIQRVLKRTGRLLLLDWCRDPWHCRVVNWWKVRFDPTYVWMYTTEELRGMLERNRFSVQELERFRIPWIGRFKLWEMMVGVAGSGEESA